MWGIRMGEIEIEEGDMLQSKRVDELMPQADVVLVDNKVFSVECEFPPFGVHDTVPDHVPSVQ